MLRLLCISLTLYNVMFNINGYSTPPLSKSKKADYIEDLIHDFKQTMQTYQTPIDNSRFKPTSNEINHFGHFDFIIVGAGSAGAALAGRLSEIRHFNILLVEAGQEESDFTKIPASMLALFGSPVDWGYKTVPQANSCLAQPGHRCAYPRGLSLGGSSAINAMAYVRGNAFEYNNWGRDHTGWSYRDLLYYFKKSEQTQMENIDRFYHGYQGPLNVERNQRHWLVDQLLSAIQSINVPYNSDYNGWNQLGSSTLQQTTLNGVRHSTNSAYLSPIRQNRRNLKILTGAFVTKVLTEVTEDGVKAVGVEFSWNKKRWQSRATKEVILSAGAINTPHILIHSGIGASDQLSKLRIPLVANIPAVGQNLADHPALFSIPCRTNLSDSDKSIRRHIEDYVDGFGNLATSISHVISFIQLDESHGRYPDMELVVSPVNNALLRFLTDSNYVDPTGAGAKISLPLDIIIMLMHPKSRGSVRTVSADPYEFPEIDPQLLKHPDDLEVMIAMLFKSLEVLKTDEFKQINAQINWDSAPSACGIPDSSSKHFWACYIRHLSGSLFHPVGTCRMGDVVDAQLRVKGVKALRIADASVIPITVAGHTNPICIVVGEKAADLIKADWL